QTDVGDRAPQRTEVALDRFERLLDRRGVAHVARHGPDAVLAIGVRQALMSRTERLCAPSGNRQASPFTKTGFDYSLTNATTAASNKYDLVLELQVHARSPFSKAPAQPWTKCSAAPRLCRHRLIRLGRS